MKKIILLSAIAIMCLTAAAPGDNVSELVGGTVGETIGYVIDVSGNLLSVVGEPLNENGYETAIVHIGDAPAYDLRTGFRVTGREIKRKTDVRVAYYVPYGGRGSAAEPLDAVVVWLNWNDDDAAGFTVVVSDNIHRDTNSTVFLCADGRYRVALTHETEILDAEGGRLSHANISPGTEFFVWVDTLTASTPALVYPDKVVEVDAP